MAFNQIGKTSNKEQADKEKTADFTAATNNDQKIKKEPAILQKEVNNPIWLSISEAAKIGGVQNRTIRRALHMKIIKYKIIGNRYLVDLVSVIHYLQTKTKLKNKLNEVGIGQYIDKWKT